MTRTEGAPPPDGLPAPTGSVGRLAGSSYLALLLGVVTGPLLARALGPTGRGQVAVAVAYAALATPVVGLGIPIAIGHALANGLQSRDALLAQACRFSLLTVPVSVLIAFAVVNGPLASETSSVRTGAMLLLVGLPVGVLANCLALFFVGEGTLRGLAWAQVAPMGVVAAATVGLFVTDRLTVLTYLAAFFASTVVTVVVSWKCVGARPGRGGRLAPLLRYSIRGFPGYLAAYGAARLDQALMGPMLGARALGFYAVSVSIALLPVAIARALASRAFSAVAATAPDDRGPMVSQFLRLSLLSAALAGAAIAAVAPLAVPLLYGRVFSNAVAPLLVLLAGTIAMCGSVVAHTGLAALGRPGQATIAELSGLAVTAIGLPLILSRYGIVAAALLSSVSYAVTFAVYTAFLSRDGRLDLRPRRADLAQLAGAFRRELAPLHRLLSA